MRRRTGRVATAALAALAALVVWTVATQVFPYHSLNHDEGVYLQQAAMLLESQLYLHPPVEGVLRPWFFVEGSAGLYPKYAPVPAAMFAVGKLLGGYRVALAAIAAANVALVVGVVTEVFDRETGLLAGGFVLCSPLFVVDSSVFLPYAPTTVLNMAFAFGYLRADRTADRRWAAVAGAAVGLAFFARPYTAVLFATPFVGHALWTLSDDWRAALPRQAVTAGLGLAGVGLALGYNAVTTGSPLVFPYQAFAPLDGLGFGRRQILAHEVRYTPGLAVRSNARVVALLFSEWVAGGLLGSGLAAVGLARVGRRRPTPREAVLAGPLVTVVLGNVLFWGNFNLLGDLEATGDGLVAVLGPYYHFDLLLSTAAFAATGALWAGRLAQETLRERLDGRRARVALVAVVLVTAGPLAVVTAADLDERVERNLEATRTYEDAYAPFEDGPPPDSLVLLPDPYGDWLNHPFQPLRNDPGFDGRAVYALDDRPFETADAFPNRTVYRYGYRGPWAPQAGSPEAARLQRVRDVSGSRVGLATTVGVPDGAVGVTVRVATDDGSTYHVPAEVGDSLSVSLVVADGEVRVLADGRPVGDTLAVDGRDVVRTTVFVDYGAGDGFSYRLELPVDVTDDRVRALSPRVERCHAVSTCGGAATYVPSTAPDGVFVRTDLLAVSEQNASAAVDRPAGAGIDTTVREPNP
jgi:4-amino-4-deoxy-L-arabinose transferase-like glycosyltransferase